MKNIFEDPRLTGHIPEAVRALELALERNLSLLEGQIVWTDPDHPLLISRIRWCLERLRPGFTDPTGQKLPESHRAAVCWTWLGEIEWRIMDLAWREFNAKYPEIDTNIWSNPDGYHKAEAWSKAAGDREAATQRAEGCPLLFQKFHAGACL